MNARERFLAIMGFETAVRPLKWEFGYWAGAVRRWYDEGLPRQAGIPERLGAGEAVRAEVMGRFAGEFSDQDIHAFFHMDEGFHRIPLHNFIFPPFPTQILEDHGDWVVMRDGSGIIRHQRKDHASPDALVAGPVQSHADWEQLKERLQPETKGRLPENWAALCEEYKNRAYPLIIGGRHGFYGTLRYLIGDERVLTMFHDDPELIHSINAFLCDFWVRLYDRVLDDTDADMALIWEDMCYKNGPLISPAMFREFMLPYYKRLTALFRARGVNHIFVDTDGDCWKLVPLFLEGGVTGLFPLEVMAGMDVRALREEFPRLQMMGGVDKTRVAAGYQAIDDELARKVAAILDRGGFIPTIDHSVPSDVPWPYFAYYRRKLNDMIDAIA